MESIGANIYRYRKENHITQSHLAEVIGVSFQAISKWENNLAMPELGNVARLAVALNVSIDALLGHSAVSPRQQKYDELYSQQDLYWGPEPTELSLRVLKHMPPEGEKRLVDLGCREGQNLLFFARNGYNVTGLEISDKALKKAEALVNSSSLNVKIIKTCIEDYTPTQNNDIYFCDEILHLLKPTYRAAALALFKRHTSPGGIHIINVPVHKPFASAGVDKDVYRWLSGELFTLYHDWHLLECTETPPVVINQNKHPRVYNIVVAQKPL